MSRELLDYVRINLYADSYMRFGSHSIPMRRIWGVSGANYRSMSDIYTRDPLWRI
jgi:hypothetical protein